MLAAPGRFHPLHRGEDVGGLDRAVMKHRMPGFDAIDRNAFTYPYASIAGYHRSQDTRRHKSQTEST